MPQMLSGPTLGLARFAVSSIPINQQTQVKLNDGTPMPVNTLNFDGKAVALAGSYPKSTAAALEAHMKMLLEKVLMPGGVNVGRADPDEKITSLFQRGSYLWRGAYP